MQKRRPHYQLPSLPPWKQWSDPPTTYSERTRLELWVVQRAGRVWRRGKPCRFLLRTGWYKWWIYNCVGCKRVDTTYERCRSVSSIKVLGERIFQGTLNRVIKLPYPPRREIFWYCGANRERTAWGGDANELSISYFHDGKIDFVVKYCYPWTHPQFCKHYLEV